MSQTKLKNAKYSINECLKHLTGYSYASKADMRHILNRSFKDLHEKGFKLSHVKGLKPKHIHVLVAHWKEQGKNTGTIKNNLAKLRKLSLLLNMPHLVKPKNEDYQIEKRSYLPIVNKALTNIDFSKCEHPLIRLSLEAQSLFGLRREESLKLIPSEAWRGNHIVIKPSWTKGGIGRTLEITNESQRQWLEKAERFVEHGASLIPKGHSYRQHLRTYQTETQKMGLKKCHGLRHAYAQRRYQEITRELSKIKQTLKCPIEGGKTYRELNAHEKIIDRQAREIISRELGHSRLSITKIYLG